MSGTRQNIQHVLALEPKGRGEAPARGRQGTEPPVAKPDTRKPGLRRATDGGGVRPRKSRKSVETCSQQQG